MDRGYRDIISASSPVGLSLGAQLPGRRGLETGTLIHEAYLRLAARQVPNEVTAVAEEPGTLAARRLEVPWKKLLLGQPLDKVANKERKLPRSFITRDGFGITDEARVYLSPLIEGEDYPPYRNGIPLFAKLELRSVKRKLKTRFKE